MYQTLNNFHNNIDDFNLLLETMGTKHLRILQWNVRGVNDLRKFDEILIAVDSFSVPIDVIILGETWLKSGNTGLYGIQGFKSIFSSRENSSGGLVIYIRNTIEHKIIENTCNDGFHHIKIETKVCGEVLEIHGVYRPPSYDFNKFHDRLETWLNECSTNRPCLIFGDVNIPVNLSNNNVVLKYKHLLQSYGYICSNTIVTRPASQNILDHIMCKISDAHRLNNHTIFNDLSDHCLIVSEFKMQIGTHRVDLSKKVTNHEKLEMEFKRYIDGIGPIQDVNTCFQNIISKYNTIWEDCTKTVTKNVNIKNTQCPWMNLNLWTLIKIKNNYLKKTRRDPNNVHAAELLKHVSKKLEITKKEVKRKYYEGLLNNTTHSKIWKNINTILGKTKSTQKLTLSVNGDSTSDSKIICETFNEYFSSVGPKLAEKITPTNGNASRHIEPNANSIFLQPSSANEVILLINDLKMNKSPGPDKIPAKIIKHNAVSFSRILSESFNLMIQSGIYPDCLKIAKVIPIFKSGDSAIPDNYRPVSTLSVLNKILEKMLINRLVNFLDRYNILYSMQYGFRNGSSTTVAITELVDKILEDTDSKKYVGALFLDLKKAFDTLNHGILLRKLENYGIRGVANNIIQSYLENRNQFVSYGGETSSLMRTTTGVPQGSNIGPLLFLIYVNDINKIGLIGTPRLFADDTALFYPHISPTTIITYMNEDLRILNDYFRDNLLSLNIDKTKYMMFRSPRKLLPSVPNLVMGSVIIERVNSFKYLGVYLDSTLSWDQHITKTAGKVSYLCGILKKVSSFVPRKALLMFYYAHIHSQLNYMVIVWGRACKSKLKKLQTLQNRCMKIIFNLPPLFSSARLYTDFTHKILPIQGLCEEQTLLFIHNLLHNPASIHNMSLNVMPRLHNTRQTNFSRPRAFSSFGQKRLTFIGPSKYNNLPRDIQILTNRSTFKAKIKSFLKTQIPQLII